MSVINGTPGADALNGTALGDVINGGDGADVIRGFGGADTLDGGAGGDRFFWNAGDGADRIEGGADTDAAFFSGDHLVLTAVGDHAQVSNLAETVDAHGVEVINLQGATATAAFAVGDLSATDVRQVVIQLAAQPGANAIGLTGAAAADTITAQVLNGGGLRVFDAVNGVVETTVVSNLDFADRVTLDAGAGNDVVTLTTPSGQMSPAPIIVHGGAGDDSIAGSAGSDQLFGDAGDDRIDGGGGSDIIDGGAGADTLVITGSDAADTVALSAAFGHLQAKVGGLTSDAVNVETLSVRALGGSDAISVGDLTTTAVRTVNIDLAGARGGQDGAADTVILQSTASTVSSAISISAAPDGASLHAVLSGQGTGTEAVNVTAIGATDVVKLMGGDGADTFTLAAPLTSTPIQIDGGAGFNTLNLGGGAGNDAYDLSAAGGRIEAAMNGSAPLDLTNIEEINIKAGEGADTIRVGDLQSAGEPIVVVDLTGPSGSGDGEADTVVLNFTQGLEQSIGTASPPSAATHGQGGQSFEVPGMTLHHGSTVGVGGMDTQDHILVNLLGDGRFDWLGDFNQTTFNMGSGDDTFHWTVPFVSVSHTAINGGAGTDTVDIGGFSQRYFPDMDGWTLGVSAVGAVSQLSLQHTSLEEGPKFPLVINLGVDLTNVERVSLAGGGGIDVVFIGDQSGTSLKHIEVDVGLNGPDQARDFVTLDGTAGADRIVVTQSLGDLLVNGLPASDQIHNLDSLDHVFIRSGAGNDLIDLSGHNPAGGFIHVDSGLGNDTMIGGFGAESFEFHGGAGGQDVVVGFRAHALGGDADVVSMFNTADRSFADLVAHHHIFQSGSDVVLTDGAGAFLTLTHTSLASLSASDVVF